MKVADKTKEQLADELLQLRQTIAQLEASKKECAQELAALASKYHQLVENPLVGIWQADRNGRFLFINKHLAEISGYSQEEIIGMSMLTPIASERRDWLANRMEQRKAGQISADIVETDMLRKDGSRYTALVAPGSFYDEEGKFSGFMGVIIDISERKHAEESTRRARDELEKQVSERTEELARSNEKLKGEIEERKEIERQLRESEEKYRLVVENASESIVVTQDGMIKFLNPKMMEISGYTEKELTAEPFLEFVHPDDRELVLRHHERRLKGDEEPETYTMRVVNNSGAIRWLQNNGVVITWQGRPATLNFLVDVTESKRAEDTLRESEMKYRTLFESSQDAIMMLDNERFFDCNKATLEMFGCLSREEFTNKHPGELSPPRQPDKTDSLVAANEHIKNALENGSDFFYWVHQKIDGTEFPAEVLLSRLSLGGRDILQAVVRDITERKRAEAALRSSEANYRAIFNAANEAIFIHDMETGEIIDVNQKMCEMFGYAFHEVRHLKVGDISAGVTPYTHKDAIQWLQKAVAEGPQVFEWLHKDRSGRLFWGEVNLKGGVIGKKRRMLAVVRDINDRKKAENERKRLEAQLQQAQKLEAIGTLAGGIAHDFNNLLTGIQGNVSLMLLGIDSAHEHYENLKSMENLVLSGARLTSQLLGYARKGKYEVKALDLNQLVQESSETFGRTRKEIAIHRELASDLFSVEGDHGQIEQVLFNLYVNAADAMPRGGGLYLKTANVTHEAMKGSLYDPKPGQYVLLKITDTGVGMDEETKRRVFEPFFTTKEMGRGTGLGLASVYGIVKSHGGYIDVDSQRDKGTVFMVYLRATQKAVEKRTRTTVQVIKGSETILLVDDEAIIRTVGLELLQQMGYDVLLAQGGAEAVAVCQKDRDTIDLVILDLIMPDMNGGEVYDRLKQIAPNIKVLLSSGYSIEGQAAEIIERGCDGFIQKPFNLNQLSQKIREILDKN